MEVYSVQLAELKGVGPKTLQLLNKLGIDTIEKLYSYYPFRYQILKRSDLDISNQDDNIIIDGVVESIPSMFRFKGHMDKMNFRFNTGKYLINVIIFNRGFLKNKLTPGTTVTIFGKYDKIHNTIIANDIRFIPLSNEEKIEGVYHSTYGLSSRQIKGLIDLVLDNINVIDYLPSNLVSKYNYMDKETSIKIVHNPMDIKTLSNAVERLKYEELFTFMLRVNYLRKYNPDTTGLARNVDYKLVDEFINKLPFSLTNDQITCVKDIYKDLTEVRRMNRLLQGDVGSGKTIVSIISLYVNYLGGYQGVLMAPTDILANQHYINITKMLEGYNIKVGLLTGKLKAKEKKEIYAKIASGESDIIIGTHALFSEDAIYKNLGLVITDEQHRFGVNQRSNLKNKGHMPDILYMSATPIPRTYALVLYGDMDISNIKTMPKGRLDIITSLKNSNDMKEILEAMYKELKENHQVYVIAPLIEESDKIDLENVTDLEDKMNKAFGKLYKIGVIHGKMDDTSKEEIMTKFKNNEINILISTTVVEVGVDVANATMMVIFDSFRFGLSTLHQLRGRVGRSNLQSYCILISDKEAKRLEVLTETNDGFKISEEDFKIRRSGDLFGIRQSGDMRFQLADVHNDFDLLIRAKEDTTIYLDNQKYLEDKHIYNLLNNTSNLD
jgi:ATP-dependent DNA helicase RecG